MKGNYYSFIIILLIFFVITCTGKSKEENNLFKSFSTVEDLDSTLLYQLKSKDIEIEESLLVKTSNKIYKVIKVPMNYMFEQILVDFYPVFKQYNITISNSYVNEQETEYNLILTKDKFHIKYIMIYNSERVQNVKIALLLTNLGLGDSEVEKKFFDLNINFSVAILPYYENSKTYLELARKNGKEILINAPMEPKIFPILNSPSKIMVKISDYINNYGILVKYNKEKVLSVLNSFDEYFKWYRVVGFTHYKGYKILNDKELIRIILFYCKKNNYYFLNQEQEEFSSVDSIARELNVKYLKPDIFLDNYNNIKAITVNFEKAKSIAFKKGEVIVVMRPLKNTYKVLQKQIEALNIKGIKFVFLSSLL